jgi:hypothetical protein
MKPLIFPTKQFMYKFNFGLKIILVMTAFFVPIAVGQSGADKNKSGGAIRITNAEAVIVGRGNGSDSMFVGHEISFCLSGGDLGKAQAKRGLRVRFTSKNLSDTLISAETIIVGDLIVPQEPLDGKSERCSKINFRVNADAVTTLKILDDSSAPRILLESSNGLELLASRTVVWVSSNAKRK